MKHGLYFLIAFCLLLIQPLQNASQTAARTTPPKVLLVVREDIKTGKMQAHTGEANGVVNIWARAKSPHHRLAMVPVAGNENEVTYLWPFDSFASLEKSIADLDRIATVTHKIDFDRIQNRGEDYHSAQRDSVAILREDLSYNPGADMPNMRFMRMQTVRVKPGKIRDYEEARRIIKAAHEKARIDENMAVYQLVGGASAGTYLVFIPWRSLDGLGTIPHGKDYWDAMGNDNREKLDKLTSEAVMTDDVNIYAFNPQLSYVTTQFVAANPDFWTLKTMNVAAAAPVLPVKKAVARTPRKP